MRAKSPRLKPPHVPLPFTAFVKGLLQVDPKKLPGKGKLTTKAAKNWAGKKRHLPIAETWGRIVAFGARFLFDLKAHPLQQLVKALQSLPPYPGVIFAKLDGGRMRAMVNEPSEHKADNCRYK